MLRQSFRKWLAERLLETKWATAPIGDDQIDAVAERLGVSPDLLLEVRTEARIRAVQAGRQQPVSRDVQARHRRLYQFHIFIPHPLRALWVEECDRRGVESATVLRSLIHEYLLGEWEPEHVLRGWHYAGRHYPLSKARRAVDAYLERATITQGARRALHRRAALTGTSAMAICRGLILEVLAGRHRSIRYVEQKAMFDDENRYRAPA